MNPSLRISRRRFSSAALLACLPAAARASVPASWPDGGTLEIVVPAGAGGGVDLAARTMSSILDAQKLIATPSIVLNKGGAGGLLAYQYLKQKQGDARCLAVATPTLLTNRLLGIGQVDHRDVSPICNLFDENIVFMVRADSPIRNGRDLVQRLTRDVASVPWGIATNVGGSNHIAAAAMMKKAGIDIKAGLYAIYKSGGEALVGLVSGQVEVVPVAAPATLSALSAGRVRLIAVSSAERLPGVLSGVPTWREQGIDITYSPWRMIVGAKGLGSSDVKAAAAAFQRMQATPEWAAQLAKNYWVPSPKDPEATTRYLEAQYVEHREILTDLGLAR